MGNEARGQGVAHFMCLRLLIVLLLGFVGVAGAQTLQPVPKLTAHVTDLTATLSTDERGRLEAKLATVEREKGAQIALLLVPTVQPEAIEQYALRVAEAWRLGRKGVDDGVLLLVAKEDRKLRIEVGYGLEGALNDAAAKRIVSEIIAPRFKQGEFYGGIDAGLDAIIRVVGGEALPPPKSESHGKRSNEGNSFETLIFFGFVLVFVVGGVLRAIFGRFLAAGIIAVLAAVVASLIFSSLLFAIVIALVAFIASLFAGATGGGWPMGGGSWGGRGGGGGFSGGGGSFGGGGASGGW